MINFINITGRLGAAPAVKTLPSGTTVTEFNVVTTEKWKDRDGNRQERNDWHRCSAFNKTGETIARYFDKGDVIVVAGKLQYDKWTDKHDQNRTTAKIVVNNFEFPLTQKPKETDNQPRREAQRPPAAAPDRGAADTGSWPSEDDEPQLEPEAGDDLPF